MKNMEESLKRAMMLKLFIRKLKRVLLLLEEPMCVKPGLMK
jgi:hypothetical protein